MPPASHNRETVDQVIDRLVSEGRTNLLEVELRKFDPGKLHRQEKESWHLHWGIAAFRRGDPPEAFRRFTDALAACPDSDAIRFSLGQEYEAKGQPQKMFELFHTCQFPKISARHFLLASRYCYLWQLVDDAAQLLRPIFDAYFRLGVADDNFLYMRGLPFFGETWAYLLCYSILEGDFSEIEELTKRAKAKLSDYSFDDHLLYLGCCKAGDFDRKIQELELTLADPDSRCPYGYQKVQLACLKSLRETSPSLLANVPLGPQDFPWLADVLLLHRARIAHIDGDPSGEQQLIDTFLQKQPLLFEPDHAANFAFVAYQEILKPRYQKAKRIDTTTEADKT